MPHAFVLGLSLLLAGPGMGTVKEITGPVVVFEGLVQVSRTSRDRQCWTLVGPHQIEFEMDGSAPAGAKCHYILADLTHKRPDVRHQVLVRGQKISQKFPSAVVVLFAEGIDSPPVPVRVRIVRLSLGGLVK